MLWIIPCRVEFWHSLFFKDTVLAFSLHIVTPEAHPFGFILPCTHNLLCQAVTLGALYPSTSAAAAHTLLAGHGAHMCSLELTWRLQRIRPLGRPNYRSNSSLASPTSSSAPFSPGGNAANTPMKAKSSRMSLFGSRSKSRSNSSTVLSPSQTRGSSDGRLFRGGNGRQQIVHEVYD